MPAPIFSRVLTLMLVSSLHAQQEVQRFSLPTTEVLQSYSGTKPGMDIGAGVALGTKWQIWRVNPLQPSPVRLRGTSSRDTIPIVIKNRRAACLDPPNC